MGIAVIRRPRRFCLKNRGGLIVVDFLLSTTVTAFMIILFFGITYTLSTIFVAQYVAFSSARAYAAGHLDPSFQKTSGEAKFSELVENDNSPLKPLFNNGWYTLKLNRSDLEPISGPQRMTERYNPSFTSSDPQKNRLPATGLRLSFEAKILNFDFAFLGSTRRSAGYKATIPGIVLREPTQKECREFIARRPRLITENTRPEWRGKNQIREPVFVVEDNGC
ncbi:MAG: hypothetical protein N2578_02315 [Bdellovibrionaceae bacterium]|nr:hypothetical protein [Pseudobdellovibrionaceae bacterium]